MKKLIIYGNGKIAKTLYQYVKNKYDVVAFTVDNSFIIERNIHKIPIIPLDEVIQSYSPSNHLILCAVGYNNMNAVREKKYNELKEMGFTFTNYIHDSVYIHDDLVIGDNNIILENVSIQPGVSIGNSNFFWSNVVLGHGSIIGDTNWIASGSVLGGDCILKSRSFVGLNASVGHNVVVSDDNFLGANVLVSKNTNKGAVLIHKDGELFPLDSHKFIKFTGI